MIIFILAVSFFTTFFPLCSSAISLIKKKKSYVQVNFTQASCVGVSNLTRFVGLGFWVFLFGVFLCVFFFFPEISLQSSRNINLALLIKMNGMNRGIYLFLSNTNVTQKLLFCQAK